jgi:hypothetical protein
MFTPPYTHPLNLKTALKATGFALLPAADVAALSGCALNDLQALNPSWARLGADNYLKDGGKYRSRRHGSCVVSGASVTSVAHRAHWQPVEYNALHGGMERWFEPLEDATFSVALRAVLVWLGGLTDHMRSPQTWFTEVHQFRIDTAGGIGRPTPEGAHRDGVDLVAVFLVARERVKGGETRVFEAAGPSGQRFTLTEPWSVLLLDDPRMIHETTPIQPAGEGGYRDTLVVTLRGKAFQDALA